MDKTLTSAADAVRDINDGASLAVGGFGLCGVPSNLIGALHAQGTTGLRAVSNNCGIDGAGLGILLAAGRTPAGVGTLVADGGLPWRYGPDGSVAAASPAREVRLFDGREYVLERSIVCDFAFVRAARGDRHGNLSYRASARNFNPLCAMAGRITIAEVEELVEPGELTPEHIDTPGVFVQRVVAVGEHGKLIEKRTTRPRPSHWGRAA